VSEVEHRPYKQVARARARERTREALLEVASEEFYGDRWQKTSLEALSAKAGVTKQTLLRHFGSKDGLLMQALARSASRVFDQRWEVPAGDVDAAVENLLDHYEEWGERSLRIGAWLDGGSAALAKLSGMARQVHYDWVGYVFGPWLEDLEEPGRARLRATLIALCDVHTWQLLSRDLGLPRSEVRATLAGAIEAVLARAEVA
jgi:AcrR family transcriptional regulator